MTQQEALDHAGAATVARYHEWDAVVQQIPSWGEEVDAIVRRFVEISRISVISNLDWSFKSQRYFGKKHEEVRRTRRINAIPMPV
ncbi:hypothetical protein BKA65DRAFT_521005 [Rhexocercosporidium sp. MPI-PUGE-AT-0058]|nr:hypothetical protein BKA65DRAFT_521005 [Rhexocercosporidium sp. MPI-PUGE-AT-0058]